MSSFFRKNKKPPFETITKGLVLRDEAYFDTEPRYLTLFLKGFIVYLVVMGSMGCLLSSFKIPYNALVIHIAVFIGALFSSFLYYTKVWENLGYFILFAFMLGTALLLRSYISSGFFAVVNIISERAAYYFDTQVVQGYAESIGNRAITVTIAFVYVGWVHAILLNALISRQMKYFAVMFASFFFLTVPFYLECEPDMLYILMLLSGCVIVFVFRGARHTPITKNDERFEYIPKKRYFNYVNTMRHHLITVGVIVALVLIFAGVFQVFVKKTDYELEAVRGRSDLKQSTHYTMANLYKNGIMGLFNRYDSTGGLKGGVLGGVNSVSLDYETDLEVTYVPYNSERLYLRSFTGADYLPYQNRWQRAKEVTTYTDSTSEKGVLKVGLSLTNKDEELSSDTAKLLKKRYDDGEEHSAKALMQIVNIAAPVGTFLPYYVDEEGKRALQFMSFRRTYDLTFYPWISDPGPIVKEEKDMGKAGSKERKKRTIEETIEKWEDGVYKSVPTDNQEAVDQFIAESGLGIYKNTKESYLIIKPKGEKMTRKPVVIGAVDKHIAQRIQLRRVMLGMSQSDLAHKCGVSFQQIQKYETAGNRIPAARLFDLSQALETPVAFFFSGLPGNFPPETKSSRSMRVSEQKENDPLGKNESLKLINLYWSLPSDSQREMIMQMLKTLNGNKG